MTNLFDPVQFTLETGQESCENWTKCSLGDINSSNIAGTGVNRRIWNLGQLSHR